MKFILITNLKELALLADQCGVDRVMVDLESIGKQERQGHKDTLISDHTLQDIGQISRVLENAELQVRVNPIGSYTKDEVDTAINNGATRLMLPMFTTAQEVDRFHAIVDGRVPITLLLETPQALIRIRDILDVAGIDEIHLGLNDLHLGMGLDFMFELLLSPAIETTAACILERGVKLGIGGVAPLGAGAVKAELIVDRMVQLGASVTILSRTFLRERSINHDNHSENGFKVDFEALQRHASSVVSRERQSDSSLLRTAVNAVAEEQRGRSGR